MSPVFSFAMPSASDSSVTILNQILGTAIYDVMGVQPPSGAQTSTIFTDLLKTFDLYLLGFGTLIFAIMLFIGTMNTAADGQFLGRNWNSIWTPVRLVIGLLFIVPLQTGLCVGQYIFLYLILIGVNIGSGVWNYVVLEIFQNNTPPAIPTYVNNYALMMMEEQVLMQANRIMNNVMGGNAAGGGAEVDFSGTYIAGQNVPAPVITALVNEANTTVCNDLFTGSGYIGPASTPGTGACAAAVNAALLGGGVGASMGAWQLNPGATPMGESIAVWFGMGTDTTYSATAFGTIAPSITGDVANVWPSSGGDVYVSGHYIYSFAAASTLSPIQSQIPPAVLSEYQTGANNFTTKLLGASPAPDDPNTGLIFDFVNTAIGTSAGAAAVTCGMSTGLNPTDPCSLQPDANQLVADAQGDIQAYDTAYGTAEKSISFTCTPPSPTTPTDPPTCTLNPSSEAYNNYVIAGLPSISPSGVIIPTSISVPLLGSWWNAGASYMIIDSQFSSNLQLLTSWIQNNELNFTGSNNVTGSMQATTNVAIVEAGQLLAHSSNYPSDSSKQYRYDSSFYVAPDGNTIDTQYGDQLRYFNSPLTLTTPSLTVNLGDMGMAAQNWANDIMPYNPTSGYTASEPSAGGNTQWSVCPSLDTLPPPLANYSCNSTGDAQQMQAYQNMQTFYQQLQQVPPEFQAPIDYILQIAQASVQTHTKCAQYAGCYIMILPYLQNVVDVLADNGALDDNPDVLPVNQAMGSMFNDLFGNAGTTAPGVANQAMPINSIMQEIYDLGMPNDNNVFAQQFSLIQQVRNVGIGTIVTCMNSMENVYNHYTLLMTDFVSAIQDVVNGNTQAAAEVLAGLGSIPIIGSIFSGMGSAQESMVQLDIATMTLTTMANVGIQLMWLPLFLFIMTSLFTIGIQFSMLIPFMPYIMFWAGSIAWVLGVLEALVAAPLVMLGLAHPGGHEYAGHTLPALRMMMGVVFRPVLMVIGMITGILLTYVLISYSAQGFHIVAAATFDSLPPDNQMLMGVMCCLLVFTYASFLVMAFTKCFSPIYSIPEQVVQWIGGQAAQAGKEETSQFSGNVQQTAQQGAQAGGQSMQQGIQAQESKGQKMSELSSKTSQTQFDVINSQAQGASQGATSAGQAGIAMATKE